MHRTMPRTKASAKRRQQKRRLEREAEAAAVDEAREAEGKQPEAERIESCEGLARESSDHQRAVGGREGEERAATGESIAGDAHDALGNADTEREGEKAGENVKEVAEDKEEEEEEEEEEESGGGEGGGGGEEEAAESDGEEGQLLLTDYEKQREQRIKENAAKLASLNLPSLASSLGSSRQRPQRQAGSTKRKKDDDYVPSSGSDSSESDEYNIDENPADSKNQQRDSNGDFDEDQALQQAIALSLDTPADNLAGTRSKASRISTSKRQASDKKGNTKKKKKGMQEQFTVDEIASIFAIIDDQGKGKFSVAELERVARSHDFTWSNQEIADMIDIFDDNKDGQLDLSEFQSIFGRMNMLRMHMT